MLAGTADDFTRYPRQLRHGQAITLAGRARQNMVQEHDTFIVLGCAQMHVGDQRFTFGQYRQFEVVRGKQGVGAQLGQTFCCSPGQGQAVKGTGATTHFVHQHQAAFGGVVQNIGGFAHLDHKGRTATCQVITGTDPGKDAVNQRQFTAGRRYKAANMGQQHDQCGLAHVGRFTAHVRTGDHQHAGVVVQPQVVGHKRRGQHLLDHRVATLADTHARLFNKARAVQVQVQRPLGQVAQHIQLGQCGGGVLQRREVADHFFEQSLIQHLLAGQGAAFGRQGLVLEGFELRGDKALGALERLAPDVIGRCLLGLFAWQLDKVTVDAVVANLEVGQPGTGFFAGFQVNQELAGVFAQGLQLIQLGVIAGFQYTAITDHRWRVVVDGFFQQGAQLGISAGDDSQLL